MSNTLGKAIQLHTFGESHGEAIGFILDGFPSGVDIDLNEINNELSRRKPGQSKISSPRKEDDELKILSGIFEGKSLGTPIAGLIFNKNTKSKDYDHLKDSYRPGHADKTYDDKYGIRDHRGGGRSSARETANWVAGGALAYQIIKHLGINFSAYVSGVGNIELNNHPENPWDIDLETNIVRCPDQETAEKMIALIEDTRKEGDSLGGTIRCVINNVPKGLGEPIFDKLSSRLAQVMMGINAVKGFQIGSGFNAAKMKGSEHNDAFENRDGEIRTKSNNAGGIVGGISSGEDIYFDLAFKPVASIYKSQESVDKEGKSLELEGKGRHDPCVVPRAVPIVENLAKFVLADFYLLSKIAKS